MIVPAPNLPTCQDLIVINPEILGGTPVFKGTRVPVQTLFDHLEIENGLEVFLLDFPYVTREQAVAMIRLAASEFIAKVPPS